MKIFIFLMNQIQNPRHRQQNFSSDVRNPSGDFVGNTLNRNNQNNRGPMVDADPLYMVGFDPVERDRRGFVDFSDRNRIVAADLGNDRAPLDLDCLAYDQIPFGLDCLAYDRTPFGLDWRVYGNFDHHCTPFHWSDVWDLVFELPADPETIAGRTKIGGSRAID